MLKSTSGWKSNGNGTDAFGFSAPPAGGYGGGSFFDDGSKAYFWSSTEYGGDDYDYAYYMHLYCNNELARLDIRTKTPGFSVRCLRD